MTYALIALAWWLSGMAIMVEGALGPLLVMIGFFMVAADHIAWDRVIIRWKR